MKGSTIDLSMIFLLISVVLAGLAAFGVSLRRFSFLAASVAFLAGAFLVGQL